MRSSITPTWNLVGQVALISALHLDCLPLLATIASQSVGRGNTTEISSYRPFPTFGF